MNKFLNLFAFCKIVDGTEQSIICDFQKLSIKYIPNSMVEVIKKLQGNEYLKVKEEFNDQKSVFKSYVDFLIKEKFVFFSDERDNFVPIENYWVSPEIINNAILEYNFENYKIEEVLDQLDDLNCKFVEIRFLDYNNEKLLQIEKILNHCNNFGFRSMRLFLPYIDNKTVTKIYHKFKEYKKVEVFIFYNSPKEKLTYKTHNTVFVKKIMDDIRTSNFNEKDIIIDLEYYLEAQKHNPYYNKKVSINYLGNVKNCIKNKAVFGNINISSLLSIVETKSFQELWYVSHDKISGICTSEMRYNRLVQIPAILTTPFQFKVST
ncbi:hypothetical protein [Flavobacterium hiemivividum]|uniref:Grasp-with-spasm system SPASM domain peptide maturase n=1 Tax=Flavobacterium hiemivividum TaxID=2541734 RepID=A0A4R5D0G4_9FLAO|nr:hypothetical protein [Flavobacterium hiemivividum]TDE03735.1 hypothetical protein E0F98_09510 [Flavobacterium hiemivividum]